MKYWRYIVCPSSIIGLDDENNSTKHPAALWESNPVHQNPSGYEKITETLCMAKKVVLKTEHQLKPAKGPAEAQGNPPPRHQLTTKKEDRRIKASAGATL